MWFQNDRMAADCAIELRKMDVAFISLWPGLVRTEQVLHLLTTKTDEPISTSEEASSKYMFMRLCLHNFY